jgi:dCMP deaminase
VKMKRKNTLVCIACGSQRYIKAGASTQSAKGATLYLTLSPCKECSKLILQAGITRLVYINEYSDDDGISFLRNHNIEIEQISDCELKK